MVWPINSFGAVLATPSVSGLLDTQVWGDVTLIWEVYMNDPPKVILSLLQLAFTMEVVQESMAPEKNIKMALFSKKSEYAQFLVRSAK